MLERIQQGDESVVPQVKITFHDVEEEVVDNADGPERIYEWDEKER